MVVYKIEDHAVEEDERGNVAVVLTFIWPNILEDTSINFFFCDENFNALCNGLPLKERYKAIIELNQT